MEIGQKVEWTSQSGSSTKTKSGIIIGIVPAGKFLQRIVRASINPGEHYAVRKHKEAFDFSGMYRDHDSYVVEVPSKSGRGKSTLYWPRVKHLKKV